VRQLPAMSQRARRAAEEVKAQWRGRGRIHRRQDDTKGATERALRTGARYQEDLLAVRSTCLLCRTMGDRWDHDFSLCSRKHEVFLERKQARYLFEAKGGLRLQPYTACFSCLNPQSVCHRANAEANQQEGKCEERDTVLPLCYGTLCSAGGEDWLYERFGRRFTAIEGYFDWLGEECRFGGGKAIEAVRVAAEVLMDYHLY